MMPVLWACVVKTAWCFLVSGRWKLVAPNTNVSFEVDRKVIMGTSDNGVRIRSTDIQWNNDDAGIVVLTVGGLSVESYPNDLFNYFKYKDYIKLFQQIMGGGLIATLEYTPDDKLRLVSARIGGKEEIITNEMFFARDDKEEKNEKVIAHNPSQ
jgi:hypothetical protein